MRTSLQIIICSYCLIICGIIHSQTNATIRGIVFSPENQPLIGALIYPDTGKPTYTDKEGVFEISFTTPGNIILTIDYLGYESVTLTRDVQNTNIDLGTITLLEKATQLKEVMVSATPVPYRGSFEGTNYYVSPLQMKQIQPLSTEEVLKTLPGVNVLGDMGLANRLNVSIRGSWGRRSEKVLLLEDGSPISPAPYTAPGIYYNPISDRIDAMEVYTGADLLRYGPNNMFGIINFITPKPPQQPGIRAKISTGQRGYFTGLLSYGGTWNKVGSQIEAVYKEFDGFTQNSSVKMLNLNAKIFAELAENQSLYFKISGQFEDNQATLSSMTPYTFGIDPTEHPFDADRFTMHRYGLDIVHKWAPSNQLSLTTKIFASDFARDWWRQSTTVIPAAQVRSYLGEEIFSERYSYLDGKSFGSDDFIRVGSLNSAGREATTDSRWNFTVAGIEETFRKSWIADQGQNDLEVQVKFHHEIYKDRVLAADSSRWSRSGRIVGDQIYNLQSISGYIREHFDFNGFQVTPILRLEHVWMERENWIQLANQPDLPSDRDLGQVNRYTTLQPGLTLGYQFEQFKMFSSIYKGFIAPSKYFAFLVERDGVLVNPLPDETISNIKPEVSINSELGIRGDLIKNRLVGQIAVFNNSIRNLYLAGWNEFFDKLAEINIHGFEAALRWEILPQNQDHGISIQPNITLLRTRVLSGELHDRHLFTQVRHTDATKNEFVSKVNGNPAGYTVYILNDQGLEVPLDRSITVDDLSLITRTVYKFGDGAIEDGRSPYSPELALNLNVSYSYQGFLFGLGYNQTGDQYAEFANFENESGDGGVGKIGAFRTFDINASYDFNLGNTRCSVFATAKNLGNDVFVASRLNRGQSGIMAGGFRQINAGLNLIL